MNIEVKPLQIGGWIFGVAVMIVGILNIFLVHVVPGLVYLILSLVYLPPVNEVFRRRVGFAIPLIVKIILAVIIFFFTLGVSDLGDMIDKGFA